MTNALILGIDLSGPASEDQTAVVSARMSTDGLKFVTEHSGEDVEILATARRYLETSAVVVGIDAPLSYQPGGGQRARDADLRRRLISAGLPPGSVMAPTFQRMAWLTLRGMGLARVLREAGCAVVEVHPGGCLALRGAPVADVRGFRDTEDCRPRLLRWIEAKGLSNLRIADGCSSHTVAACAAVIAAHGWHTGGTAWLAEAEPPWHPYDFAC